VALSPARRPTRVARDVPDERLRRLVNQRVPDPFERLFLEQYPKVVAIAYRVLADRTAAEDIAQEVFLKFHRSLSPDSERASGWLHAAAVHSALNQLRGERRRTLRESAHAREAAQGSSPDPQAVVIEADRRRQVRRALRRLPRRSAAVLLLRHSGLSYAEVATALGIKVGNVGTVLRRAEESLRREVDRAAFE
jgi:RNA polymerase sigma factor (sigma-70 family)